MLLPLIPYSLSFLLDEYEGLALFVIGFQRISWFTAELIVFRRFETVDLPFSVLVCWLANPLLWAGICLFLLGFYRTALVLGISAMPSQSGLFLRLSVIYTRGATRPGKSR